MTTHPIFKGAKPSVPNNCAFCESSFTAGCWRRGWEYGSHFYANLCNKCGLKYKNGRLNKNYKRKNNIEIMSNEMIDEIKSEYKSYTMIRQNLIRNGKRVLFYVQDSNGESILAIMGVDLKRTGHFVYKSQPGFEPALRCTNRNTVISWLANLGAKDMIVQSNHNYISNEIYDNIYKQECEMDNDISDEFELVSYDGENECLNHISVVDDNHYNSREERKYHFKYFNTRRKRKLSNNNYGLNDIFVEPELKKWALKKPNVLQIDKFKTYHHIISSIITCDDDVSEYQMTNEDIYKLLNEIEKEEVCLKLIKMTNISESVNILQNHSNNLISEIASDIIKNWKTKTNKVLFKAKIASTAYFRK